MKAFRILSRNIRDAVKSVFRNFSLSIASVSCITITLLIISISIILSYNVENVTKIIRKDFTIVAFLDNKIKEEKIEELKQEIENIENIESYEYQNKKSIADGMKETSEVFDAIMKEWDESENPLQDTFLIKVKKVERISETAKTLNEIEEVTLVRYGEGIVESLLSIFKIVEKALFIVVIALVLVTAFLIANTIKLTIFSRKKEIEIMRLVGASNSNIKLPFVIEGLILGIIGSIIPIIFSVYGYYRIYEYFEGRMLTPFLKLVYPEPFIYLVSFILIFIGALVGMWGSARAVRKHLKI